MGAPSPPAVRLQRALDAGSLLLAETAARECHRVEVEDALGICLLLASEHDARYERAAVRWVGQLLSKRPDTGFKSAHRLLRGMEGMRGTSPPLARADLALLLRGLELRRAAERAERFR